jgi:hypothetical protein
VTLRAEIRRAIADDIEAVSALLASGFKQVPIPFWRSMLRSPWLPAEQTPDIGAVIVAGKDIVGFLGAMYSDRIVGARIERFCNVFAWYVRDDYRHYSLPLLSFLVRRPNLTFVNVTPATHVVPLFERFGFVLADNYRLICTPNVTSLRRTGVRLVPESEVNETLLSPQHYSIYNDHFGRSVRRLVFASSNDSCLLITKRMHWGGVRFPRTDVFYISNTNFVARHFDQILPRILLRDKTVAMHVDPRTLGFVPRHARQIPSGALYPSAMLFRTENVPPPYVDRLYTELVLLP